MSRVGWPTSQRFLMMEQVINALYELNDLCSVAHRHCESPGLNKVLRHVDVECRARPLGLPQAVHLLKPAGGR